jgi:hypothetical protein
VSYPENLYDYSCGPIAAVANVEQANINQSNDHDGIRGLWFAPDIQTSEYRGQPNPSQTANIPSDFTSTLEGKSE